MSVTVEAPFSAAVLFADMRGYTGLAERLPPTRVVTLLDEFFAVLASATAAYGGRVFYMAGDGMMAGFQVRNPGRSGAREALAAAHAMLRQFAPVSARWRRELSLVTGIGVGLHLGAVAFGFLGPPGKKAVTLIGDTVNVAARLCSCARAGEVLFSDTVAAALVADGAVQTLPTAPRAFLHLPQFQLRGRSDLLDIWCVPAVERTQRIGCDYAVPSADRSKLKQKVAPRSKRLGNECHATISTPVTVARAAGIRRTAE